MESLGNPDFNNQLNGIFIHKKNSDVFVNSALETIESVSVFDIADRLIFQRTNCNSNSVEAPNLIQSQQTLIVKVKMTNGGVVTKKVL